MISIKYNFLYVHVPKTAGNAVQNVLRLYSEDKVVRLSAYQDGLERFEVRNDRFNIQKHSTLRDYQRELGDGALAGLFKFCCVRNPWERAISFYFSPHRGVAAWDRMAFLRLLDEMLPISAFLQLESAAGPAQARSPAASPSPFQNVDFVMRYERLEEDFQTVCRRLGIPVQTLPVRNKSTREHFSQYYDPELVEHVRQRFADEVEFFGYEFDPAVRA